MVGERRRRLIVGLFSVWAPPSATSDPVGATFPMKIWYSELTPMTGFM